MKETTQKKTHQAGKILVGAIVVLALVFSLILNILPILGTLAFLAVAALGVIVWAGWYEEESQAA